MDTRTAIRTTADLYAHALVIERDAASRYRTLARRTSACGNDWTAALFSRLAGLEAAHACELAAAAEGLALPDLVVCDLHGPDAAPAGKEALEFVFRLMTPYEALLIARQWGWRARDFFREVFARTDDSMLKALAAELVQAEARRIGWVEQALARAPNPLIDWERVLLPPHGVALH